MIDRRVGLDIFQVIFGYRMDFLFSLSVVFRIMKYPGLFPVQ